MARINLGSNQGVTDRQATRRSVGGTPQVSSPGVVETEFTAPLQLKPRAEIVETYRQVAKMDRPAATRIFEPQPLRAPDDWSRLADSLKGFNANLNQFTTQAIEYRKQVEESRQEQAAAIIEQAGQFGGGRDISQMQANLSAVINDPNATAERKSQAQLLQAQIQNNLGRIGPYIETAQRRQQLLLNAANLSSEAAKNPEVTLPDGSKVRLHSLSSADPAYIAWRSQQIYGGVNATAEDIKALRPQILQYQLADQQSQSTRKSDSDWEGLKASSYGRVRNLAVALMKGQVDREAATTELQDILDQSSTLGLSNERRTELSRDLWRAWSNTIISYTEKQRIGLNYGQAIGPFLQLFDGPKDGRFVLIKGKPGEADQVVANEKLLWVNRQGPSWIVDTQLELQRLALARNQQADASEVERYKEEVTARFAEEVAPLLRAGNLEGARKAQDRLNQGVLVTVPAEYQSAVLSATDTLFANQNKAIFGQQQRNNQERFEIQRMQAMNNPAATRSLITQLQQARKSGQVSEEYATSTITTLTNTLTIQKSGYQSTRDDYIKAREDAWKKYAITSGSFDGSSYGDYEIGVWNRARRQMIDESNKIIQRNLDKGTPEKIDQELQQLFASRNFGLGKRDPGAGQPAKPLYKDVDELGGKRFGGGLLQQDFNSNIKQQLQTTYRSSRPLFSTTGTDNALTDALRAAETGADLDEKIKKTIKATGAKPSQFFIREFSKHGITLDSDTLQRLRALDALKLSAAPTPASPIAQLPGNLANAVLAIQPASAAPVVATASPLSLRGQQYATNWTPGMTLRAAGGQSGTVNGYLKRLAYLETRIRNIPNQEGSQGMGYFQAFDAFNSEATAVSGVPNGARNSNYELAAKATWAWIQRYNKQAAKAIVRGEYDKADKLLANTWPSLPPGSQAQPLNIQREALRYLNL